MKLLKLGIRFWITTSSIFSFLIGWILLAHAPKPDQTGALGNRSNAPGTLPTLQPLTPLDQFPAGDDGVQNQRPFFTIPSRNQARPFFSTGGS